MEKILKTTASICAGLILLVFIEALFTFGNAFDIEQYTAFGWFVQSILVLFTISFSAWLSLKDSNEF
jgi:hypothetical protein